MITYVRRNGTRLLALGLVSILGCSDSAEKKKEDEQKLAQAVSRRMEHIQKKLAPPMPSAGEKLVTTKSGLKYVDVKVGEGDEAKTGDTVYVIYTGWLKDGNEFDSSVGRGPVSFRLGEGKVLTGLEEGIHGMKMGGKRKLTVPASLGYGTSGRGDGSVPPDSELTFEVELFKFDRMAAERKPTSPSASDGKEITTRSGLKYVDLKEGSGIEAKLGDSVLVHYTGWLKDGTQFDSSIGKRPFSFRLGGGEVIRGWDEGVVGIKIGGKRKLIVPPELGYGAGAKGPIPPHSELTFEVELLKVN